MTTQLFSSMKFRNGTMAAPARLALASTVQTAVADRSVIDVARRPAVADICDLIEAAGPLALCDIAGGLDVPVAVASPVVQSMIADACVREDEWGRFAMRRG